MIESKEKYVHFRNFMANELQITRADIEDWTKQAVTNEVRKIVSGIDIRMMVSRRSDQLAESSFHEVKKEIAKNLTDKIAIRIVSEKI